MAITVTVIAKIDGDHLARTMQIEGLKTADIGVKFEVSFKGHTIACDTPADVAALLKSLIGPPEPQGAEPHDAAHSEKV